MSDDRYLWDNSGRPDPLVERLERTLAVRRPRCASPARRRSASLRLLAPVALAAAAAAALWLAEMRHDRSAQKVDPGGASSPPAIASGTSQPVDRDAETRGSEAGDESSSDAARERSAAASPGGAADAGVEAAAPREQ